LGRSILPLFLDFGILMAFCMLLFLAESAEYPQALDYLKILLEGGQ